MSYSFFAMLSRMKHILRWGLMRNSVTENLSEHTLEVAYIAHALAAMRNARQPGSLDCGQAVLYALYHDCSEILTGDLPTPVKYCDPALRNAYKAVEHASAGRLLNKLPPDIGSDFAACFNPSSEYRKIVKAADKLSALIKCIEEERMGNQEFTSARKSTLDSLHAMEMPEVERFIADFLPAYSLTLDEL